MVDKDGHVRPLAGVRDAAEPARALRRSAPAPYNRLLHGGIIPPNFAENTPPPISDARARSLLLLERVRRYHRRMVELSLVEFPADDPERARRFWEGLLGVPFAEREDGEGHGRQTRESGVALGLHERGPGPGDRFSLPYFAVADVGGALARVQALGGEIIHPGEQSAICRDCEGSPFGLARS